MGIYKLEKYKLCFIFFSRCWSKTMTQFIYKINKKNNLKTKNLIGSKNILKEIGSDYKIFIFVRSPYTRILSSVIAHEQHHNKTFIEFLNKYSKKKSWIDDLTMSKPNIIKLKNNRDVEIINYNNIYERFKKIIDSYNLPITLLYKKELNFIEKEINKHAYNIKLKKFKRSKIPKYNYFYNEEIKKRSMKYLNKIL
jgi:hypothetical protein